MAPITRSSLHGRQSQLDDNQEGPHTSGDEYEDQTMDNEEGAMSEDEGADDGNDFLYHTHDMMDIEGQAESSMLIDTTDAQAPFRSSAQEMLRPLQDTAERVSRQVEEFAKVLDKFGTDREPTDDSIWEDALVLLEHYATIATKRKDKTPAREGQEEKDKLQLESDLWILVGHHLDTNSPRNHNNVQLAQESELGALHRYSTNEQLWTAFLDSDPVAQEYESTLSWLHNRAQVTSPPVENITHNLITKASRGDGLSTSAPFYTGQKIKQQKRTRVWSIPLESSNPGLSRTHVRESDQAPLVAQLDPDARTREPAVLEDEDEYYDQAGWQTYWEMLRRGQCNKDIQSWFAERKMLWRHAALRGSGTPVKEMMDSPWFRILNLATSSEWLERCRLLAQNPAVDNLFQQAVYGVLCGDVDASRPATENVEDYLFCIFNSLLIQRYQQYLYAFRKKASRSGLSGYQPQAASTETIRQHVNLAQSDPSLSEEIHLPHKFMELATVSQELDSFLVAMGRAAAHVAHATGQGALLMHADKSEVDELASLNAQDQDCVRTAVHLQLLLQSLGLLNGVYAEYEYELENNIAAYIGLLESLGRWLLIPLYASKLSEQRRQHVLGAILINVTDPRERDLQVKLMKQYSIDVSEVAYGIFSLNNFADLQKLRRYKPGPIASRITMLGGASKVAQLKVRPGLMVGDLNEAEEKAVRSVEWIRYVDTEHWAQGSWSVAVLYKIFLLEGRFVALRELLVRVPLSKMSLAAVGMNLHFTDTATTSPPIGSEDDDTDIQPMSSPNRKRKPTSANQSKANNGASRQSLALESLIWKQLEQLVAAIDALDAFQEVADALEESKGNPTVARTHRRELKEALNNVRQTINPILNTDFLCQPQDENEAVVLNDIRNHYIPEVILAYNSTLWFAGHYSSRTWLVECMNLAQIVAETPMLTAAFVASGRMKELVRAFAVDSQTLLQATEQGAALTGGANAGRSKKIKADKGNADIWKVTWKEDYKPLDLEAMD